jgi:hypothetical protein
MEQQQQQQQPAYTEYMLTIYALHDPVEKHCSAHFCVQFAELTLYGPGTVLSPL